MIKSKLATAEDFNDYLILKTDENNVFWTGDTSPPNKEKLFNWYLENIKKENRLFFLFYDKEFLLEPIGYLYMDIIGELLDTIDTGHGVNSKCGGKGYGTKIIEYALNYAKVNLHQIKYLQGWIANDNIGSIKNFLKNGYYKTDETKIVKFGDGSDKLFEKYMIDIR